MRGNHATRFTMLRLTSRTLGRSPECYDRFLGWLGYKRVLEEKDIIGWNKNRTGIFLFQCAEKHRPSRFHRKRVVLNHLAFRATTRGMVDEFYHNYLLPNETLFPLRRPEKNGPSTWEATTRFTSTIPTGLNWN